MWDICEISVGYSKNMYILDIFLVIIWEFRYISSYILEYWDISLKTQPIYYKLFYRYIILRNILVKAWQKKYSRDILYQLEGWQRKNLIYRPILRVGWEAHNPYQSISFRSLSISIKHSKRYSKTIYKVILRFKYIELSELELRALIFLIILLKLYL